MTGKRRVAWREGMFLLPQHFQQQDRYIDAQINTRISGTGPYAWGLLELNIDENLALLGKFAVTRCHGVMPDGTSFSIPDDIPPPPPIDIPNNTRDTIIYLTLPASQEGAVEFKDSETDSLDARFLVEEAEIIDAYNSDRTQELIEYGRPNLRFGFTKDMTYGRVTLGLARVREVQNKRLLFDDRFIPPALDLQACARLKGGLTDILGRAEQRAEELAIYAAEATDGGSETFVSFLLLQALNRWCPILYHQDSLPMVHPERLYETLAGMAGELATLTRLDRKAPRFPAYDHENLQLTFEPVLDLLRSMLAIMIDRSAIQIKLDNAGPGAYVAPITDHSLFKTGYFYLAVNAAAPLDEIRLRFPAVAKIGAVQKMRAIVESALPGVPLRHAPTPPPQLRVLPGYIYFELDRGVSDWRDFATAPGLGLHVAGEWPSLKLELWCVKRGEK